jgi:hypothetical protein
MQVLAISVRAANYKNLRDASSRGGSRLQGYPSSSRSVRRVSGGWAIVPSRLTILTLFFGSPYISSMSRHTRSIRQVEFGRRRFSVFFQLDVAIANLPFSAVVTSA